MTKGRSVPVPFAAHRGAFWWMLDLQLVLAVVLPLPLPLPLVLRFRNSF
jgi:hypothetical protein